MNRSIISLCAHIVLFALLALHTAESATGHLPKGTKADLILVEKKARRLSLLWQGRVLKSYQVALGEHPDGPKLREGDGKTPEGIYYICGRNRKSRYYLSLRISYPSQEDIRRAQKLGVSPGGDIMIHGISRRLGWVGERHRLFDWTNGCIAVTNQEMDEIWRAVADGTAIEIRP